MDEYLASLVRKEDNAVPVAEEVQVEEIAEPVVEEVADTSVVEPDLESVVEEVKKEKPAEEKKSKKTEKKVKEEPKKVSAIVLEEGSEYDVYPVRVYKTPDTHQVSQLISGKVIYEGKAETFSVIEYMKHGFGLVKGYVQNLEASIKL